MCSFKINIYCLSEAVDYKVRFFTPTEEVDLCGHATIAAFNLLRDLNILSCGTYTQEKKAGILSIVINENDVLMEQNKPQFGEIISLDKIPESRLPIELDSCFEAEDLEIRLTSEDIARRLGRNFEQLNS